MAGFPLAVLALNRAGIGGLRSDISGAELREAGLRAIAEVAARLRVDARHVVFGHTHRAGPLPGDDPAGWSSAGGAQLHNSGSWVYEPNLATARSGGGPYWPGTAVELDGDGPPRVVELLRGLSRESLAAVRR
jgi:hypothetical protein